MPTSSSGLVPSSRDRRDLRFRSSADALRRNATFEQVLLHHPVRARDQGRIVPCCVSMSVAVCMEVLDARSGSVTELSPLFHYYAARSDPAVLSELSLREGFAAAAAAGLCARELHDPGMDSDGAAQRPSPEAFQTARQRRIAYDVVTRRWEYRRLPDANRTHYARDAIRRGMPVAIGLWLTPEYAAIAANGNVHPPAAPTAGALAHAVVARGFDNSRAEFVIKDSQGPAFADGGEWRLPFALFEASLVFEAWTVDRLTYDD